MSYGEAIAEAVRSNEADDNSAISDNNGDRLSTIIEEASDDLLSDPSEEDQQSFQNFADTYFSGADLNTVQIVYNALAAETDKETPVDARVSEGNLTNPSLRVEVTNPNLWVTSDSLSEYPPLVGHSSLGQHCNSSSNTPRPQPPPHHPLHSGRHRER